MRKRKIFGLGWCKTGTTSLEHGLIKLGFTGPKSEGKNALKCIETKDYDGLDKIIQPYEYFCDYPWFYKDLYKHLDTKYPGSLFILTKRETSSWHRSNKSWFSDPTKPNRYNSPVIKSIYGDLDICVDRYEKHNSDVIEYFKDRDNFLLFCPTEGETWDSLCNFLGCDNPHPGETFMWSNKQEYKT